MRINHDDLIKIGSSWLKTKCAVVLNELKSVNQEIPDIIAFTGDYSFVIEAKISFSDFKADQKKPFRINSNEGVGDFRFYIALKGVIDKVLLPEKWGLIEVDDMGYISSIYNPFGKGNIYSNWIKCEKNQLAERRIMFSALRRISKNIDLTKIK